MSTLWVIVAFAMIGSAIAMLYSYFDEKKEKEAYKAAYHSVLENNAKLIEHCEKLCKENGEILANNGSILEVMDGVISDVKGMEANVNDMIDYCKNVLHKEADDGK